MWHEGRETGPLVEGRSAHSCLSGQTERALTGAGEEPLALRPLPCSPLPVQLQGRLLHQPLARAG